MLLPVDMREWLPRDHLVWFVLETVDALDATALERSRRRGGAGAAGYDPRMLFGLLVYAYCQGVRSSRQIERMCITDVAFRVLCAQDGPDHTTIARFRAEAQEAFSDLFAQVLMIAARAGLGRFGTVAVDGTKIKANASIDANRGREWFNQNVTTMLVDADRTDQAEDTAARESQVDDRQDRVPPDLGDRTRRRERIQLAAQELDAEHQEGLALMRSVRLLRWRGATARSRGSRSWGGSRTDRTGWPKHARTWLARSPSTRPSSIGMQPWSRRERSRWGGRRCPWRTAPGSRGLEGLSATPRPRNRQPRLPTSRRRPRRSSPRWSRTSPTPQSRIMPTRRGFLQGYNAHVAVTGDQLIVAVRVGQSPNDQGRFTPMMRAAQEAAARLHAVTGNADHVIGTVLADAGYNSDANLKADGPDRLIAPGKGRDQARAAAEEPAHGAPPAGASPREANAHRLRTLEGRDLYKRRGAIVEPGIGNLKKIIDCFSRRGLDNATSELHLAATACNLMKVHRAAPAA